jgi:hypothetical protein
MSTKSSIILTNDNEHWYKDCAEPLSSNPYKNAITLEFSKKNIRVDLNDEEDLVITVTNPDCEIYKILSDLDKQLNL